MVMENEMQLLKNKKDGFTLIEVAIAIGVLSFGLTAILIVYLTSLRWAEEIRIDLTSLHSARAAIFDAAMLTDESNVSLGFTNTDAMAEGWMNDYYIVRTASPQVIDPGLSAVGSYYEIKVQVYYGGNSDTGRFVQELNSEQFVPSGYAP